MAPLSERPFDSADEAQNTRAPSSADPSQRQDAAAVAISEEPPAQPKPAWPPHRCLIVVPCYNEAARLPSEQFLHLARTDPSIHFLFVNDGSTDTTLTVLQDLCALAPASLRFLNQQPNAGKAEAVRAGIRLALASSEHYTCVGFWDADLATPLDAIPHLLAKLDHDPALGIIIGARVRLLGRSIHRNTYRHYLGRLFATCASLTLTLPIYDTQCGAKIFRTSPTLNTVFAEPFLSKWIFDVEIIARFLRLAGREACCKMIFEYPLHAWRDVAGSKVRPIDFFHSLSDLIKIRRKYF